MKEIVSTSQIDEGNDSDDHAATSAAVINSLQRPSSPHKRSLNSTSIDTTMWMHRSNRRSLTVDDSLTSLIDISDNKNRDAAYDIYDDNTVPMSEITYKKIHKRSERIDSNERESRSKRTIDSEGQHTLSGRSEWQDFMGPLSLSGGSAARTRPQFPPSITIPVPTPNPTPKLMVKFHNHSQSQIKSDKGLSKSQSATLAAKKQHRQCLTIEQSKSVQTFDAKQSNANKSITSTTNVNVNRCVADLGNHVTKLRRNSQQAKDISNNFYSPSGKNFYKDAMQGDFDPSAIQLGFLF